MWYRYVVSERRSPMIQGVIGSILYLLTTACLMIVVALLFSGSGLFKTSESENGSREKILISIVFGLLAIAGTLMGTEVSGAIANVRELAPSMAGLIGGPISGMLAGIIGGIHRYSLGGFTALPCSVSTVLAGIISGIVSKRIRGRMYLLKGAILGALWEIVATFIAGIFRIFTLACSFALPLKRRMYLGRLGRCVLSSYVALDSASG